MLDKEQVINSLYDFVDEYGSPFATTCPEEMSIIEDALDMYYEKQKTNTHKNMRYEVEQHIDKIDRSMFLLSLLYDNSMDNPTEEELTESLKIATSCMKLITRELAKKNITLKELNDELRS